MKKFLGTFFFSLVLILSIAVVFDFTEKVDDFIEKGAPTKGIIFDYYLNFIPYFANLFTPLFVFISVIFFTSKMAYQSEIIAILSSGVSFRRLMFPYFVGALVIASFSFVLGSYIIPPANEVRLEFEFNYIRNSRHEKGRVRHLQIEPGVFVFLDNYYTNTQSGSFLTIEKFDNKKLISRLTARKVQYDTATGKWHLEAGYFIRDFIDGESMKLTSGEEIDTTLNMLPSDFKRERFLYEKKNLTQLSNYISDQEERGMGNIEEFVIEKYKRIASPFSAFILTLIGVSLASRKVRGGMGVHIGIGLGLSFGYILFMTVSTTFAIKGTMDPLMSVWLPNFVFATIGAVIYHKAPK